MALPIRKRRVGGRSVGSEKGVRTVGHILLHHARAFSSKLENEGLCVKQRREQNIFNISANHRGSVSAAANSDLDF